MRTRVDEAIQEISDRLSSTLRQVQTVFFERGSLTAVRFIAY